MKQAEEMIDKLLDWADRTPEPNLTQIEDIVLKLRQELSEQMALEVIYAQEEKQPVPGPRCPICHKEMHYKGQKGVTIESWVGELSLERGYYHCPHCRVGLFPPRPAAGVAG